MVRLGNKSKLKAYHKRVLDLDEKYFHGAAHRFFGALPTKVPGGDLRVSKKHFDKAFDIEADCFTTRTLCAELYATKARDKKTFIKQIEYLISTPAHFLPDAEPKNRYKQEVARKLKEQTHEWFDWHGFPKPIHRRIRGHSRHGKHSRHSGLDRAGRLVFKLSLGGQLGGEVETLRSLQRGRI